MTGFNVVIIGFLFGIGFVIANTLLTLIDKLLAIFILKSGLKIITKPKGNSKPPKGLNFGNKI